MGCRCFGKGSGCIGKRDNGLAVFRGDVEGIWIALRAHDPHRLHVANFPHVSAPCIDRHFAAYWQVGLAPNGRIIPSSTFNVMM